MATKNIKPRGNGEGYIGTSVRKWLGGFFKTINIDTEAIVPTPANNDNSTKAATTAWVENAFFTKLVAKLLATTAATITSLSTSSLFYRFLEQALSVAGVKYNLSNSSAWYICLGSLFGGLIIQGGYISSKLWVNKAYTIQYPITMSKPAIGLAGQPASNTTSVCLASQTASTLTLHTAETTGYSWLVFGV